MKLHVIDYVANPGGGVRFVTELLAALLAGGHCSEITLVSYGEPMQRYRSLLATRLPSVRLLSIPPRPGARLSNAWHLSLPGMTIVPELIWGADRLLRLETIPEAFAGADVAWFPWMHRHALPAHSSTTLVATFHDTIGLEFPGLVRPSFRQSEMRMNREWFESSATITMTSNATAESLRRVFGVRRERMSLVRLCGAHVRRKSPPHLPREWNWVAKPFLLCPANTSPHKNHETLLKGFARWQGGIPLVLTGHGTDFGASSRDPRGRALWKVMRQAGLRDGDVIRLGYVDDDTYYGLLRASWAVVMPTLAEGGGSFPVTEALLLAIPVVCSDIPIMREAQARENDQILWFSPRDPDDLCRSLHALSANHRRIHEELAGLGDHSVRSWCDVASDYAALFANNGTL